MIHPIQQLMSENLWYIPYHNLRMKIYDTSHISSWCSFKCASTAFQFPSTMPLKNPIHHTIPIYFHHAPTKSRPLIPLINYLRVDVFSRHLRALSERWWPDLSTIRSWWHVFEIPENISIFSNFATSTLFTNHSYFHCLPSRIECRIVVPMFLFHVFFQFIWIILHQIWEKVLYSRFGL